MAHPGAGACGGVGGDCARRQRRRWRRGEPRFGGWAQRLAAHAQDARARRGACVLARDAGCAVAVAGRGRARSCARHQRHGRASHAHAAGGAHGSVADAGAGGVPWRHQRCAADRLGGGDCGLVPAARPGLGRCGAARSGGTRARGGVRGCRPVAHGGLVHQPVPGAARSRRARCRGGDGGRRRARARAQEHQGAAARAARQRAWLWAAALSEPADGFAACRALPRRRSASTISGALRLRRRRTGAVPARRCGSAAAIPPCRSPIASRSMRSRWTSARAHGSRPPGRGRRRW